MGGSGWGRSVIEHGGSTERIPSASFSTWPAAIGSELCILFLAHSRFFIKSCGTMDYQVALSTLSLAADGETSRAIAAMLQSSRDTNTS